MIRKRSFEILFFKERQERQKRNEPPDVLESGIKSFIKWFHKTQISKKYASAPYPLTRTKNKEILQCSPRY